MTHIPLAVPAYPETGPVTVLLTSALILPPTMVVWSFGTVTSAPTVNLPVRGTHRLVMGNVTTCPFVKVTLPVPKTVAVPVMPVPEIVTLLSKVGALIVPKPSDVPPEMTTMFFICSVVKLFAISAVVALSVGAILVVLSLVDDFVGFSTSTDAGTLCTSAGIDFVDIFVIICSPWLRVLSLLDELDPKALQMTKTAAGTWSAVKYIPACVLCVFIFAQVKIERAKPGLAIKCSVTTTYA